MRNYSLLITLPALLLSACAVGPDYEKPGTQTPIKWPWERIAESTGTATDAAPALANAATIVPVDWWKSFNDTTLTTLVEEGLRENADLTIAAARVAEARALLSGEEANLYPQLSAQGGALRQSQSQEARFGAIALNSRPFNQLTLSAVLDWEIDLWGKLRRANESARASLLSIKANQDAVRLAVASEIANGYFNLRALDAQIDVNENTITARDEAYAYQQKQYDAGSVDGLTYKQAEAELAAAKAQLPALRQARDEQRHALAVLAGRTPQALVEGDIARGSSIDALPTPPAFKPDIPSTLLERRPDIQVAEQNLISSNAQIGVAKADYFPTLSLSSLLGLSSANADRLLRTSARTWQLGANAAVPILDFGRVSSRVDAAKARKEVAMAQYQQVVRQAFAEVLDSMSAIQNSEEQNAAQATQSAARAETLRIVRLRYDAGYSNYLDVLDAQRTLFQAQLARIDAKRAQLTSAVNLYKALGGGWSDEEIANDAPVTAQEAPAQTAAEEATETPAPTAPEPIAALIETPNILVPTSKPTPPAKPVAPSMGYLSVPETVSETAPVAAPIPATKPTPPVKVTPPSMGYLTLPETIEDTDIPADTPSQE